MGDHLGHTPFAEVCPLGQTHAAGLTSGGEALDNGLRYERITDDELNSALRKAGLSRRADAAWVVIETNGQLSVIPHADAAQPREADLIHPVAGTVRDGHPDQDDRGAGHSHPR